MLDIKYVVDHPELVKENCRNRNMPADVVEEVDRVVALEHERKALLQEVEGVRQRQNEVAQATGKEKDPAKRAELVAEGKQLKTAIAQREETLRDREAELKRRLGRIPSLTHPDAPVGKTEDANKVVRQVGAPRQFDFKPKDHVELGKTLDLIDFETGGKVTGHGFYFLKNEAVLLDLALQQFALNKLIGLGFTPVVTPDLARNSILEGIGFTPRGPETQVYSVENSDLSLVGTAEITLGGMHSDEILSEDALPLRYAGLSHCFRTEAGAAGRASRGLYRVHQFTKVEMFGFTTPETAGEMHLELLRIEEEIFQALGVPFR
ncbi:MAG TPA: serine--tRNA ligase, partial [Isosphaeraceae bacterium]|nr:serine--tRNA ligase [Isosphaeraceae bacterium]